MRGGPGAGARGALRTRCAPLTAPPHRVGPHRCGELPPNSPATRSTHPPADTPSVFGRTGLPITPQRYPYPPRRVRGGMWGAAATALHCRAVAAVSFARGSGIGGSPEEIANGAECWTVFPGGVPGSSSLDCVPRGTTRDGVWPGEWAVNWTVFRSASRAARRCVLPAAPSLWRAWGSTSASSNGHSAPYSWSRTSRSACGGAQGGNCWKPRISRSWQPVSSSGPERCTSSRRR